MVFACSVVGRIIKMQWDGRLQLRLSTLFTLTTTVALTVGLLTMRPDTSLLIVDGIESAPSARSWSLTLTRLSDCPIWSQGLIVLGMASAAYLMVRITVNSMERVWRLAKPRPPLTPAD